ncbi:interferon-inducible GTPase 5-like [Talpa occidentalis]|uniref:interferon-inducible GTPase 5-like n=1 Tax=Talpa occidentalis TaxID=50954 RepID=UPI00188F9DD7|nr:interferon-inducible GTPase 5-like [Talpa occidentalis]
MASSTFQSYLSQIWEVSQDTRALKEAFEEGDLPAVAAKLQATLHSLENVRLDIGITGGMGSGKSTFVNVIRGLGDEDPRSACTGVVEMTMNPTPYPHPKYPNVIVWDLPSIGTASFQVDSFPQRVLLDRYDIIIFITSDRFTANQAQLALGILQQGQRVYFIRSKVDVDVAASRRRRPSTFCEKKVLSQIRDDCRRRLQGEGLKDPRVFLISMFELGKYDFHQLQETMVKELDSRKRHVLLMALPNISEAILEKKAASLRHHIWLVAMVACGINPSPVPGVEDVVCNLTTLTRSLQGYDYSFGLDKDSLVKLAEQMGQPLCNILGVIQGPRAQVTEALVLDLLGEASKNASAFTQGLLQVPILDSLATCGISFATIYQMLRRALDVAVRDAQRVLHKASLHTPDQKLPDHSHQ